MRKLKIALLHYSCPPVVGGVEEVLREQASLLHKYRHSVKIFAGNGRQYTDQYEVEINPLLSSRSPRILQVQRNILKKEKEFHLLTNEILDYLLKVLAHFDVVIAHNVISMHYNLPLTYALHQLAESGQTKAVSWNHDSPYFFDNFPSKLLIEPWNILKKYNPNIHYVTISETRRQQFSKLYGERKNIEVIPNGIDPLRFFPFNPTTLPMIQKNHLFEADFIIAQPCRLNPRKNIELSICVIKALQDKGLRAKLLLSGDYDPHEGKSVSYLRKLKELAQQLQVEKDILFIAEYFSDIKETAVLDRTFIRDMYLIADMLFMPSIEEGFGIPLLEAGMIKLPIVCSNIPSFQEIANENARYFSLDDTPEEIGDKIIDFMRNLSPSRMFRKVINQYLWDNIYHRKILPFLEKLVGFH